MNKHIRKLAELSANEIADQFSPKVFTDEMMSNMASIIYKHHKNLVDGVINEFSKTQATSNISKPDVNIAMEDLEISKDQNNYLSGLNEFPRLKNNIASVWGSIDGRKYIFGLIVDERDRYNSDVNGFPPTIVDELAWLLELHDKFYPCFKPAVNIWNRHL